MYDGAVLGTDLYIYKYPNVLIKVPISTGIPTYQYTLSYPSLGSSTPVNYDSIGINGLGNIVLGASATDGTTAFIVPLNSTSPTTFVTNPTAIKFTGAGFLMSSGIVNCTTTNTYMQAGIRKTTSPVDNSVGFMKLPPNGNLTFGPTGINYTVGTTTYSGTLQGSSVSPITLASSSATRTALTLSSASVASSVANVSPATTTSGITTYSTQLV